MMDTAPVRCERFELVLFSLEFIDALLAGDLAVAERELNVRFPAEDWLPYAVHMLRLRRADLLRDPSVRPWITRAMALPDRRMAGYIGFHGAPDADGIAEMGYTVFDGYRRQGLAYEAARAMMDWACTERGVRRFRVTISPANAPSLAMAAKLGFAQTGEQMDEIDGLELVFDLQAI
jgi:RimJ/RimL family protein N-acetyltransferase